MVLPYSNLQITHRNPGAEHPLILPVQVLCNTSNEQLEENIRINARRPGKWVQQVPAHPGVAVLCGSGPSLADQLDDIRRWRNDGAIIFAMNGAAAFLADHGILPDYQVVIDAREETACLVGPSKHHLFASQVHPACFDKMPTAQLWHLQIMGLDALLPDYDDSYVEIGGAASVGNTALCLAYALGYRRLEIYGYDSSHRDGKGHAFRQAMNDGDPCAWVTFCGKDYLVSLTMKLQAEKFQRTARELTQLGVTVTVHGDGLLPAMWNTPKAAMTEQEKYERMWAIPAYRAFSPGEEAVEAFCAITAPATVLDLGCGTGRASVKLKAKGYTPTLTDFTDNSRDYEAMVLPFLQWDLTHPLPVRAQYGFCADVMEHIPTESVPTVLANIFQAVDACFFQISTVPDQMGGIINQDLHVTVQPAAWWVQRIQEAGRAVQWITVNPSAVLVLAVRNEEAVCPSHLG